MGRCVATGAAIAEVSSAENQILQALNDLDYGEWQWKTHDEVKLKSAALYQTWHTMPHLVRFPGGESLQELVARAGDVIRYVLEVNPHETVSLVGHESVNRALLLQLLEQPLSAYWRLSFDPCGITEIDFVGAIPQVLRVNETLHLARLLFED